MDIYDRMNERLDVRHFANAVQGIPHIPLEAARLELPDDQYVLRMMVKCPHSSGYQIPPELDWLRYAIHRAAAHQRMLRLYHPFVYVTVRSGVVRSLDDDEWHTDGFSMRIPHVPEQNYVWTDCYPTEHLNHQFTIPDDFDPLVHNIHQYFQDHADGRWVREMPCEMMHMIDPYVVHRRPRVPPGTRRTFFRISFVPIEIEDDSHTINPLLVQRKYGKLGLATRAQLKRYGAQETRTHYGTEWDHHIVDHTYADDGFGNLLVTNLDVFFLNVDQISVVEH